MTDYAPAPPEPGTPEWHVAEAEQHLAAADAAVAAGDLAIATTRLLAAGANAQLGTAKAAIAVRNLGTGMEWVAERLEQVLGTVEINTRKR